MKKLLGNLMSLISGLMLSTEAASFCGIGVEDMPQSLKEKR